MAKLSENIKTQRKAHKLTQQQLADYLGINKTSISKIERGKTENLKSSHVEKLCKLFGCTPADLYGIESFTYSSSALLSAEQQELLALIPLLNAEEAKALLEMVKAMFGYKKYAGL